MTNIFISKFKKNCFIDLKKTYKNGWLKNEKNIMVLVEKPKTNLSIKISLKSIIDING